MSVFAETADFQQPLIQRYKHVFSFELVLNFKVNHARLCLDHTAAFLPVTHMARVQLCVVMLSNALVCWKRENAKYSYNGGCVVKCLDAWSLWFPSSCKTVIWNWEKRGAWCTDCILTQHFRENTSASDIFTCMDESHKHVHVVFNPKI